MTDKEKEIQEAAIVFANKNKKSVALELTNVIKFPKDPAPVSVFMAGSPGAGKTESSQNLIHILANDGHAVLRIDSDELRSYFDAYNGSNSHLFQAATSILADCVHDFALSNKQSFIFDGTLSNLSKARTNIERSLSRNRFVQIIYVYQDPIQAWEFVKARELRDGRHISKEVFIEQYFQARENVNRLKQEFGAKVKVDLITKNIDGTDFDYKENVDKIDRYIPERYSVDQLRARLSV